MLAPAAAADLSIAPIYKAPPPAPVTTWSGSYLGVSGGGAWGKAVVRNDAYRRRPDAAHGSERRHHWADLRIQYSNRPRGARPRGRYFRHQQKGERGRIPAQRRLQQRGQGAVAFNLPRPGGIRSGQLAALCHRRRRARQCREHRSASAPGGQISDKQWHWGWTAGGGVEVKLTQDWTAKVEYLYVGLQDKSYFNPAPSLAFPSSQRLNLSDHIVRVGVNYKLPWNILDGFFKR